MSCSGCGRWTATTLADAVEAKVTRIDPSFSDHSVDRRYPRWREEPSSGRGDSKRATLLTPSDSYSSRPPPQRP